MQGCSRSGRTVVQEARAFLPVINERRGWTRHTASRWTFRTRDVRALGTPIPTLTPEASMSFHSKSTLLVLLSTVLGGCGAAQHARSGVPPQQRPEAMGIAGSMTINVAGIPSVEGKLFVELYDRDSYFHYEKVLNEQIVPVSGTTMTVTLEHVPRGRYVVVVSHDANANGKLDTNFFGAPTEVYGFSRGARGAFGPPDFEAGAFDFNGERVLVPIALR